MEPTALVPIRPLPRRVYFLVCVELACFAMRNELTSDSQDAAEVRPDNAEKQRQDWSVPTATT